MVSKKKAAPAAEELARVVRKPYERVREGISFKGTEQMTVQHLKDETDINNIVKRYHRTGELPQAKREGSYEDVSELNEDYGVLLDKFRDISNQIEEYEARKAQVEREQMGPPDESSEKPNDKPETTENNDLTEN